MFQGVAETEEIYNEHQSELFSQSSTLTKMISDTLLPQSSLGLALLEYWNSWQWYRLA